MDKAEFLRLCNEAHGQPLRMVDFDHLVPGWGNRVAYPYNLPIEAGLRSEIARLAGKRYLVAVLHREYDYDGLFEQLFFDEAFLDPMEAVAHAQQVQEQHTGRTMAEHPDWRALMAPAHQWPAREEVGARLLRLLPQKAGDGTGFNSREIYVVVLPIDPDQPLSAGLFQILDKTPELNALFRGFGAKWADLGLCGCEGHNRLELSGDPAECLCCPGLTATRI